MWPNPWQSRMKMTPEVAPLGVISAGSGDSVVIQDMRMGCRKTLE